jgi:quinol monooxygenase YgiN
MLAFEVYGQRSDLYSTHLSSPAMADFLAAIPEYTTTNLDLAHYRCVAGVLDLHGDRREAGCMQDVRITCVDGGARERVLGALQGLVQKVQREEEEEGNGGQAGVETYMGFASLDDEVGVRIFGRWRERRDLEEFVRREDVGDFWKGVRVDVARMEQRIYVPNGKGWLHRGEGSGHAGE